MFLANLNHHHLSGMSKYQSSDNRTKYSFFDTMPWPILRVDLNMADFSLAYPNHKLLSPMSVYPSVKVAVKVGEGGRGLGEGGKRAHPALTRVPGSRGGPRKANYTKNTKSGMKNHGHAEMLVGFDRHRA